MTLPKKKQELELYLIIGRCQIDSMIFRYKDKNYFMSEEKAKVFLNLSNLSNLYKNIHNKIKRCKHSATKKFKRKYNNNRVILEGGIFSLQNIDQTQWAKNNFMLAARKFKNHA